MIRSFGNKNTEHIWNDWYVKSVDRMVQRAISPVRLLAEPGAPYGPKGLLKLDGKLLAETLINFGLRDIGERPGIDHTATGIVDDHAQLGGVPAL